MKNYHEYRAGIENEHRILKRADRELVTTIAAVAGLVVVIVATVAMILGVIQ